MAGPSFTAACASTAARPVRTTSASKPRGPPCRAPRPLRALCVVPIGMEEGTETDVPGREIGLVVGEPARFRFFGSAVRKGDCPGDVLASWSEDELQETDPLEAELPADPDLEQPYVPVRFQSRITELGMFELWCVGTRGDQRWKLEFNVREEAQA